VAGTGSTSAQGGDSGSTPAAPPDPDPADGRAEDDGSAREPGAPLPLVVEAVDGAPRPVLKLRGDLDQTGAPVLTRAVDALPSLSDGLALDFDQVPFVDSSGLSALIHVIRRAAADGAVLTIQRPNPLLVRLLETTGVDVHLVIEPAPRGDGA
jgi:anti-sigma B factor antagonist